MVDADGFQNTGQVKFTAFAVLQGHAIEGISLLAGHCRGAVVEDANRARALVVHGVDKRGKP